LIELFRTCHTFFSASPFSQKKNWKKIFRSSAVHKMNREQQKMQQYKKNPAAPLSKQSPGTGVKDTLSNNAQVILQ
jgi:hypothetical protein